MEIDWFKFFISCLIFFITDIIVWFQLNGYRVINIMDKYQLAFAILLGVPIALGYFYAWKFAYDGLGSWWSCRLLGFGISFLVFPVLTHYLLKETMFRPKILVCIFLSILIVSIQVFWNETGLEQNKPEELVEKKIGRVNVSN